MRALTRDSGKEVSVLNGDFEFGNDGLKSEHVWRLCDWTRQEYKSWAGPDQSEPTPRESPVCELSLKTSD